MDYERLESRISNLETEIQSKLTWSELIWTVVGVVIGAKIIDYFF